MKAWLIFLVCIALLLPAASAQPAYASLSMDAATGEKVLVEASNQRALAQLQTQGARMLVDYGAYSLWRLPASSKRMQPVDKMPPGGLQPVRDEILLRGITLNPLSQPDNPALNSTLWRSSSSGDQLWLVQFIGPVQDAWLTQLIEAGLQPVAYVPNNTYVVWGQQPEQILTGLQAQQAERGADHPIQWSGPYYPSYRLSPELRTQANAVNSAAPVEVTIQFYTSPELPASLDRLKALPDSQFSLAYNLLGFTNLRGRAPAARLAEIASWPDVFNIEGYQPPVLLDEIQGQIVAGNVTEAGGMVAPDGPGYLAWLDSKGFPTDPNAYPLVDVVDDGLDAGDAENILHPDFYELGDPAREDRVVYIANCTPDLNGNGVGGHGNLNVGIVAGYNNRSGFPYEDGSGYQLGLGISPYGSVASTKVFSNTEGFSLSKCGTSDEDYPALIDKIYEAGARISSNSWGSPVQGAYTSDSQVYDVLTRDASSAAGLQEMLHVFAAGNNGSRASSINAPGSAKNVLTVGASENVRNSSYGCYTTQTSSAGNIPLFSSRGPTSDLRMKPDLVAPGTNVQGQASLDPDYTGRYVCGRWYPSDQTRYTWSTGTSHATPAAAGAAQLVYEYYGRVLKPSSVPGQPSIPSPAMLKALLLNTPRYLSGTGAGSHLPGPAQGWGGLNIGPLMDGTPRIILDQEVTLTASGEVYHLTGQVADPARPVTISLVWSDAPGNPAAGAAWVNNLDLEVRINGQVYTGNFFQGAYSAAGGGYDSRNNVETIFLPPGQAGDFQVRVIARNIAGDGLPGNDDLTDQDFALVFSNGLREDVQLTAENWIEVSSSSNQNGWFEPGETLSLAYSLQNVGDQPLTGLNVGLTTQNGGVSLLAANQLFPNLAVNAVLNSPAPFIVQLPLTLACGAQLDFSLTISSDSGVQQVIPLTPLRIGSGAIHQYPSAGPWVIPDRTAAGAGQVLVPLSIADNTLLTNLDVRVSIHHPLAAHLILSLISPSGSEFLLSSQNGGFGSHYQNTIFDDQETFFIRHASAPFEGRVRPEQALSALEGKSIAGLWHLKVQDVALGSSGQVTEFSLIGQQALCQPASLRRLRMPIIFR